jgi:hypothetical protein
MITNRQCLLQIHTSLLQKQSGLHFNIAVTSDVGDIQDELEFGVYGFIKILSPIMCFRATATS